MKRFFKWLTGRQEPDWTAFHRRARRNGWKQAELTAKKNRDIKALETLLSVKTKKPTVGEAGYLVIELPPLVLWLIRKNGLITDALREAVCELAAFQFDQLCAGVA